VIIGAPATGIAGGSLQDGAVPERGVSVQPARGRFKEILA
jgi:hypothetical protein